MKASNFILIIALLLHPFLSPAQGYPSVMKVQGQARVFAIPEMLEVNIPVQVKEATYEACSSQLVTTYNDLSTALIKAGINKDEIKSSGLNIQEYYNYYERERKLEGYTGNIQISIKLAHSDEKLQSIMRTLRDERFKFGYNLGFSLSEKQKETLEAEAIKNAIADATMKGTSIVNGLGMKVVSVHEVNYGYTTGNQDILTRENVYMAKADMEQTGDLQLNPQLQEVYRNVGIIWHIVK